MSPVLLNTVFRWQTEITDHQWREMISEKSEQLIWTMRHRRSLPTLGKTMLAVKGCTLGEIKMDRGSSLSKWSLDTRGYFIPVRDESVSESSPNDGIYGLTPEGEWIVVTITDGQPSKRGYTYHVWASSGNPNEIWTIFRPYPISRTWCDLNDGIVRLAPRRMRDLRTEKAFEGQLMQAFLSRA